MKNALLLPLLLLGCSKSADVKVQELVGASNVSISRVSLYQGPEVVLAEADVAVQSELPIIGGRDAMIRVFYSSGRAGEVVTANLELSTGDTISQQLTLVGASTFDDLDSTLNFRVPGELIADSLDYRVSIVELGDSGNMNAVHPDEGLESHPVEPNTPFKLTLVPYQYDADGSGRLPNMSPATITGFKERFRQLYPISDIEISVHDPVRWSQAIDPNGAGWQDVIMSVYRLRAREFAADDEYYYAMFNPRNTLSQFCERGCLLGVTLLNNSPRDVGDPMLRMALGLGYPQSAADTMLHELGHAHGRSHAPCGRGVDPNSIDGDYPHTAAKIGGESYDIVNDTLISEDYVDIMSYCDPGWISDYNYSALYTRMNNIRTDGQTRIRRQLPEQSTVVIVEGDGTARWAESSLRMPRGVGDPVEAEVITPSGVQLVSGELIRYDHLPGGLLVLPVLGDDVQRVAVQVDGLRHEALAE